MWYQLASEQSIPVLDKVLRTIAVYALLAVIFRFSGKRGLAAMNTFDIVVVFLLANVVQNAVIGPDDTISGAAVGAFTLVSVNAIINRVSIHWPRMRRLLEGKGRDVIVDGVVLPGVQTRLGIQTEDLDHAVRLQNGNTICEVKQGVLEPNGQLILTLKASFRGSTQGDVREILTRLERIEDRLTGRR